MPQTMRWVLQFLRHVTWVSSMGQQIYTVAQINKYIQNLVEQDGNLLSVCIKGEISNYKLYPSGHHYFSLKDSSGSIRCVMFKSYALRMRFRPENGMQVLAVGRISVFPRDGVYQLYCTNMIPDGLGDLFLAFEQTKQKLAGMGMFDTAKKKALPKYPETIALVTSAAGAAVCDMIRILRKRYPLVRIRIFPVRVQGREAPAEIAEAIAYVNHWNLADLIITGRGGGSAEDLWAFNEEVVAYAIYRSAIPVISAVGHEPDITIADYVSDLRAATPSNAAELAVPDKEELRCWLLARQQSMVATMEHKIRTYRKHLLLLKSSKVLSAPTASIDERRLYVDHIYSRLSAAFKQHISQKKERCIHAAASLDAMSPLKVLGRGYAIVVNSDGQIVRTPDGVQSGEPVTISLEQGKLQAHID